MEKKNPNIYQRALDIVNHRINPDIPQGGGEYALKEDLGELDERVKDLEEHGTGGGGIPYKVGTKPPAEHNIFWVDTSDNVTVRATGTQLEYLGVDPVSEVRLDGTNLIFE